MNTLVKKSSTKTERMLKCLAVRAELTLGIIIACYTTYIVLEAIKRFS